MKLGENNPQTPRQEVSCTSFLAVSEINEIVTCGLYIDGMPLQYPCIHLLEFLLLDYLPELLCRGTTNGTLLGEGSI